ncbi:hypothetical protein Plhal304r1_c015g0056651 [Plasmopara halstedii]
MKLHADLVHFIKKVAHPEFELIKLSTITFAFETRHLCSVCHQITKLFKAAEKDHQWIRLGIPQRSMMSTYNVKNSANMSVLMKIYKA